jgi:hypothetical protein
MPVSGNCGDLLTRADITRIFTTHVLAVQGAVSSDRIGLEAKLQDRLMLYVEAERLGAQGRCTMRDGCVTTTKEGRHIPMGP